MRFGWEDKIITGSASANTVICSLIDHVIATSPLILQLSDVATGMKKRKLRSQNTTLTKIDPGSLRPKPFATSQHATGYRGRVTTSLDPVQPPLAPPPGPEIFEPSPLNLNEEHSSDEGSDSDDDIARGYYADSVWPFHFLGHTISHARFRTIHC